MTRKFVVLTTQRSGSSYFCFWLNNHPNVRCHSELFLREYSDMDGFRHYCNANLLRKSLYNIFGNKIFVKLPHNLIISNLIKNFYYSLLNNPSHSGPWTDDEDVKFRNHYHPRENPEKDKAVGFKLMYNQLEYYGFLKNLIKSENLYVVHLIRSNVLKMHLSKLTARRRKIWHSVHKVEKAKMWVDPKTILDRLSLIIRSQERMKEFFPDNPYLEIVYEDFFDNHLEISKKVLDFLGVGQCEIRAPNLKKLNPDSTRQVIENYDEIFAILKGTPYEHFLD
jgi:hypothetical protein